MKTEVYKQMVLSVVRHLLSAASAVLITRGIISQDQSDFLITEGAGILFAGLSLLVAWIKTNNGVKLLQAALDAAPGTTLTEIKAAAKQY